jgi:hypothetical protein
MVMQKRVMKYMTKMGQKTGTLKSSKKVQRKAMTVALVAEYQNLNSGSRRMKGRNSSFCRVGSSGPSARMKHWHFFGTVMIYCGSGSYFGKG